MHLNHNPNHYREMLIESNRDEILDKSNSHEHITINNNSDPYLQMTSPYTSSELPRLNQRSSSIEQI